MSPHETPAVETRTESDTFGPIDGAVPLKVA